MTTGSHRAHGHRRHGVARPIAPLAERALSPARPRGAAIRHPPLLRHPRDDGRRHQPGGGRARLRHAARRSSRPASASLREGGPTTPATTARSSCAGRWPSISSDATAFATTRPSEILITVGASEAVDLALRATCDPGRRGHPPRAVVRGLRAGDHLRRRRAAPACRPASRMTSRSIPAAVEAAITPRTKALFLGYPCNPTGAVLPPDGPGRARRRSPSATTCSSTQRRDLRPPRLRRLPPPGDERPAGDARADDPHGRLLQGLRHDRLAGRLAVRSGAISWRASSRSTSTGSCRPRRWPRTPPSTRSVTASRTSCGWCAEYDRRRRLMVDGLNAIGLRDLRAAGRLLRLPQDQLDGPRRRGLRRAAAGGGAGRGRPGRRLRSVGRGPRPRLLRHGLRAARGGARPHRAFRRAAERRRPAARGTAGVTPLDRPPVELVGERYEAVIGIEVHCQLRTASKMFCACSTAYDGAPPN